MHVYKPHEPIGHDVPPEIYLGLMLERRKLDLQQISYMIRGNSVINNGSLVIPFHIEEYVDGRVKEMTKELRSSMTKSRKEEIPLSYIEKFLKDAVMAKI